MLTRLLQHSSLQIARTTPTRLFSLSASLSHSDTTMASIRSCAATLPDHEVRITPPFPSPLSDGELDLFPETGTPLHEKPHGFRFYEDVCKKAKFVLGPMVDASELPWRMISRAHGAQLAYSPMYSSGCLARSDKYRDAIITAPEDRPLFYQLAGDCPETVLRAAQYLQDTCDAIDINLGCPQNIAKRGHYGSFLQNEWDLIFRIVNTLHLNLKVPVTVKIRVFDDVDKTIRYAKMIERAGASILTVHGRMRDQRGQNTGLADWEKIKAVKNALSIPVFANGNVLSLEDVQRCIDATGVDGVMSAEGNLYNPAIFSGVTLPAWQLAREYLNYCQHYGFNHMGTIRGHMFKLFYHILGWYPMYRQEFGMSRNVDALLALVDTIEARVKADLESGEATEFGLAGGSLQVAKKKMRISTADAAGDDGAAGAAGAAGAPIADTADAAAGAAAAAAPKSKPDVPAVVALSHAPGLAVVDPQEKHQKLLQDAEALALTDVDPHFAGHLASARDVLIDRRSPFYHSQAYVRQLPTPEQSARLARIDNSYSNYQKANSIRERHQQQTVDGDKMEESQKRPHAEVA
ncbi:tRNA-dihydrouridine synthase 1 [Fonticula alba]|uniref:tRNA-dihydrouridine(16/17) synthase [NAD(P)(+)] n=1 Tax=Fonticula alba TaxID=691883 RepID=A0A058Z609_FONAL|nr:tRNA-dihydrouridine synthase 1 [Fonticula alba]KCV69729.1 tRNA-dihydrouridine synthase 1 [Fonticula alba]|eukprot:XP_009496294.1 tRNA-dihydrouridine synthase 1 [Fonticula alba]